MHTPALFHLPVVAFLAAFVLYWFQSSLPVTLTKILRRCGFRRKDATYWPPDSEYEFWVRPQWAAWLNAKRIFVPNWVSLLIQLILCPYCVTFHLTWLSALVVFATAGLGQALWCVTYPILILIAYKRAA